MDISSIGKSPQERSPVHLVQEVNWALSSAVLFLTSRSKTNRPLSPRACSRLGMYIAQHSHELLRAELLLKKQRGNHE